MKEKKTKISANSSFYLALCICVLVVALIGYMSSLTAKQNKTPQVELAKTTLPPISTPDTQAQGAIETKSRPVTKEEEPKAEAVANPVLAEDIPGFIAPIDGEVRAEFSGDQLVYHEAVSDWRTHDGVDIAGNLHDDVQAAADGVIEEIHSGSLGESILIDHQNGYKTLYANLSELPDVQAGKEVKQGEIIGKIGESALADCTKEPHLHFEVLSDGKNVDPLEYIE